MIHAVLFDLDHTLWERDTAVRRLARAQHAAFPALAGIPAGVYVERVMALDDHGVTDKKTLYRSVATEFGLPRTMAERLERYFLERFKDFFELVPDALSVLTTLRAARLKTGLITNGGIATQEAKIEGLGLAPLMDTILISEREQVAKPDPEIFRRALARLQVDASAAWFVGDHPEFDIRGAAQSGLTAVWLRSWAGGAPHAAYSIATLSELLPLVLPQAAPPPGA